jgi:hypothetical protein
MRLVFTGALLCTLLSASTALGAVTTVSVRVEGASATLLPTTTVTLGAPEPVSGCPANSVAAAINLAVNGNWDHGEANNGGGDFTETILGETHAFTNESDTWAEWVNYKWGGGICTDLLSDGDQVLMVADHEPGPSFAPTVLPLVVGEAPNAIQVGTPFTVHVSEIHTRPNTFAEPGEGTPQPVQGVTVSGAGVSAITDEAGAATITLTHPGSISLRATKPGDAPSSTFTVCAYASGGGACGIPASLAGASSPQAPVGAAPLAPDTGPFAVVAHATGLLEGHVYSRGSAPRLLQGTVELHTALRAVNLRLTRMRGRKCSYYDGLTERFRAMHCGVAHGRYFSVGDHASFSYLLPAALSPGRYVLDIEATDVAGNHTSLARGSSRIVFYVK